MKYVLTIAGSDPCGGAGIQADIKTIAVLRAHPMAVVTAITAQNSLGIGDVYPVPPEFVRKQLESVLEDITPHSLKIGVLVTGAVVDAVAEIIQAHRLAKTVLDPVLRASTGRDLLNADALSKLKSTLLPLIDVVTPNMAEAEVLSGQKVASPDGMEQAAKAIKGLGPNVVITGGHLEKRCVDVYYDGKQFHHFSDDRLETDHTHGSGCVFSSALSVFITEEARTVDAVKRAHHFTRNAIKNAYPCGRGAGAVNPVSAAGGTSAPSTVSER
jgi:hydroxymethylpyrimidine kinase/phosphomethylpyrimidine kinase